MNGFHVGDDNQLVIPTAGADVIINGRNFGVEFATSNRNVTVDGRPCSILSWSDDVIECSAPSGTALVRFCDWPAVSSQSGHSVAGDM